MLRIVYYVQIIARQEHVPCVGVRCVLFGRVISLGASPFNEVDNPVGSGPVGRSVPVRLGATVLRYLIVVRCFVLLAESVCSLTSGPVGGLYGVRFVATVLSGLM